jgi:hypothetical protein
MDWLNIIPSIAGPLVVLCAVIIGVWRFQVTKKDSNKIEFMKQINDYENELIKLGKEFPTGPNFYKQYRLNQFHKLYILNRIAYLFDEGLLKEKTVDFFQFRFEVGFRAYDWANEMEEQTSDSELAFFLNFKTRFPDYKKNTKITPIQKYYLNMKKEDPGYIPSRDGEDPRQVKNSN